MLYQGRSWYLPLKFLSALAGHLSYSRGSGGTSGEYSFWLPSSLVISIFRCLYLASRLLLLLVLEDQGLVRFSTTADMLMALTSPWLNMVESRSSCNMDFTSETFRQVVCLSCSICSGLRG